MNFKGVFQLLIFSISLSLAFSKSINLVHIVDESSALMALINIHSVIKSSESSRGLLFHFIVITSGNFSVEQWNTAVETCNPEISYLSKEWIRPEKLSTLEQRNFDKDVIYARFYIPRIFPDLDRFVYLDNDAVVNIDVAEIYFYPLVKKQNIPTLNEDVLKVTENIDKNINKNAVKLRPNTIHHRPHQHRNLNQNYHVPIGFVFEKSSFYDQYIKMHFNSSRPLVQRTIALREEDIFFNAGVFLMDAKRWRQLHYTDRAEKLFTENKNGEFYDSAGVGDQGLFFLLMLGEIAYLPQKFNMRRLPAKSIRMLDFGVKGVIHFAGTMNGDPELFCKYPLLYPVLYVSAIPLYLSIASSFSRSCPNSLFNISNPRKCNEAILLIQQEFEREKIKVKYDPGKGKFTWPPPKFPEK